MRQHEAQNKNRTVGGTMSDEKSLSRLSISEAEKKLKEINELLRENISTLLDICETKRKIHKSQFLAHIEEKVYPNIKK